MEEHKNDISIVKESDVHYGLSTDELYEKAEVDKIKKNLARTYSERFELMIQLIRMNSLLSRAKIIK